ncbi:hypothetical protein N658DRAFT_85464 [Parathielavia hyrcaniae]|uniref:Uncharacterized protein n=1 Tax=Parathielavia hyrcaniae TaxID=113614 RepID=A0AAN6T1R6_9PEZI|nr:hypothetical protein N658DRAFT_85464 [Parathielavia hyrcaniae]
MRVAVLSLTPIRLRSISRPGTRQPHRTYLPSLLDSTSSAPHACSELPDNTLQLTVPHSSLPSRHNRGFEALSTHLQDVGKPFFLSTSSHSSLTAAACHLAHPARCQPAVSREAHYTWHTKAELCGFPTLSVHIYRSWSSQPLFASLFAFDGHLAPVVSALLGTEENDKAQVCWDL